MRVDSHKPSDKEIIRQVLEGNINAFETLLFRYKDPVSGIVKKHVPCKDVEETIQEIFIRAYKSLSTYKGKGTFRNWLISLAVRACYDYWRKAYRSHEVPMCSLSEEHRDWLEEVLSDQSELSGEEMGVRNEARELLDWALGRLSPEDRMVLELTYLEGMSGREAAELLGWSVANVKVRSFRSRKKLEKMLKSIMKVR